MRRPTRPQRPALVAGKLIVHLSQGVCKLFFTRFYRHFCIFVCFPDSCIVMPHNVRFLAVQLRCWCCRWCELNHRRRVNRFKRCLRLRSCVYSVCVHSCVFASFGGFILPFAFAVAVCAVVYARARFLIYARGTGYFKCLGGGGVTSPYNSNKNAVVNLLLYGRDFGSMNLCIYVSAYQAVGAGIRGQG